MVHLTLEQRRELVKELTERGWSTTRIAERLSISDETARRDRGSTFVEADRVIGKDGKRYPAVIAKNRREEESIQDALADMDTSELTVQEVANDYYND